MHDHRGERDELFLYTMFEVKANAGHVSSTYRRYTVHIRSVTIARRIHPVRSRLTKRMLKSFLLSMSIPNVFPWAPVIWCDMVLARSFCCLIQKPVSFVLQGAGCCPIRFPRTKQSPHVANILDGPRDDLNLIASSTTGVAVGCVCEP